MQIYRDHASILEATRSPSMAKNLVNQIEIRIAELVEYSQSDMASLVNIFVWEEGDTTDQLEAALGFPVLHNRWTGVAHDAPGFDPSWDAIEAHADWYELTFVISDDGFGFVVFIPMGISNPLTALCQRYTGAIP